MDQQFWIDLLGIIGILCAVLTFQSNRHKHALLIRTANELSFGVQYFLLGAYTGMAMDLIGCARNLVFTYQGQRGKSMRLSRVLFALVFSVMGVIFWEGPVSILVIAAKVISTFAYGTTNMRLMRFLILLTSASWLFYNIFAGSHAGIVCEAMTIGSILVGMLRYDVGWKGKKDKKS